MKRVAAYLLFAFGLLVVGVVCLGAWWLERRIAEAEQAFGSLAFERSQRELDDLEQYLEYGRLLPWIGSGPVNEMRAKRVAADYWRGDYGRILPAGGDPMAGVPQDNAALQLVMANAVYREGIKRATDRDALLQVIDRSLSAYGTVLRNAPVSEDAAYNYEYLRRLRSQTLRGGRRQAPPADAVSKTSPHGVQGAPPPERDAPPFEILIPQPKDDEDNPDAGDSAPVRRRG